MDAEDARQAEEWLRGLGRHDPLSPVVRAVLDGAPVTEADGLLALQRLQTPEEHPWREVALSALLVGQAPNGEATRQRALSALRAAVLRPAHRGPVYGLGSGCAWSCGIGAVVLCVVVGAMFVPVWDPPYPVWRAFGTLVLLGGSAAAVLAPFVGVVQDRSAACPLQSAALRALGHMRDVASIGAMADACLDYREQKHRAGEAALEEALPGLSSEDYGTIGRGPISALCAALRVYGGLPDQGGFQWKPDVRMGGLILDALERVAGGSAVEAVRQVAEWSPLGPLRQKARAVLPALEARRAHERDAARLLRPAEAPAADQLLRPADGGRGTPQEELLRAVAEPRDEQA